MAWGPSSRVGEAETVADIDRAGCLDRYDTHIYIGNFRMGRVNVERRMVSNRQFHRIDLGCHSFRLLYVADRRRRSRLQWFRDHLALEK